MNAYYPALRKWNPTFSFSAVCLCESDSRIQINFWAVKICDNLKKLKDDYLTDTLKIRVTL